MEEHMIVMDKRKFRYMVIRESVYQAVLLVLDWTFYKEPDNVETAETITSKVMNVLEEEMNYR